MSTDPFNVLWNDCLSLVYNKEHWVAAQKEINKIMHNSEDNSPNTANPASSPLMEAVSKIYAILEPLTPDERIRVIKATCILLDIPISKLAQS